MKVFQIQQPSLMSGTKFLVVLIELYSCFLLWVAWLFLFLSTHFHSSSLIRAKKRSKRGIFSPIFLEKTATVLARNPNNTVCYINSVGTIMPPAVTTLHAVCCCMQFSLSQRGWLPKEQESP